METPEKKLNEKIIKYFPISNYGENKLLSELYIKSFCKKKNSICHFKISKRCR